MNLGAPKVQLLTNWYFWKKENIIAIILIWNKPNIPLADQLWIKQKSLFYVKNLVKTYRGPDLGDFIASYSADTLTIFNIIGCGSCPDLAIIRIFFLYYIYIILYGILECRIRVESRSKALHTFKSHTFESHSPVDCYHLETKKPNNPLGD